MYLEQMIGNMPSKYIQLKEVNNEEIGQKNTETSIESVRHFLTPIKHILL